MNIFQMRTLVKQALENDLKYVHVEKIKGWQSPARTSHLRVMFEDAGPFTIVIMRTPKRWARK